MAAKTDDTVLVTEPQHPREKLRAFSEHGQPWVECLQCGRQWSVDVASGWLELVTEGDGYCDENPKEDGT